MLGEWISRRWPLKWRSERTERGGSGKWKLGQVRVTKHGIYTLPFQRRGQAHCMWAGACICIRRILRMWDPAMARNPMQDPSLAGNQVSMVGCVAWCVHSWWDVWLTHYCLFGKSAQGVFGIIQSGFFGKVFFAFCNHHEIKSVTAVWSLK